MNDYPIIFSAPMVRALIAGNKTMTRRLAWRPARSSMIECKHGFDTCPECDKPKSTPWQRVKVGDRLWIRENFSRYDHRDGCWYWADGREARWDAERPRPSIHMPRWASRITIVITATKVEPLQAISYADAMAEGVQKTVGLDCYGVIGPKGGWLGSTFDTPNAAFSYLWMSLHGPESWRSNPEVVALSGRVILANIDSLEAA